MAVLYMITLTIKVFSFDLRGRIQCRSRFEAMPGHLEFSGTSGQQTSLKGELKMSKEKTNSLCGFFKRALQIAHGLVPRANHKEVCVPSPAGTCYISVF